MRWLLLYVTGAVVVLVFSTIKMTHVWDRVLVLDLW